MECSPPKLCARRNLGWDASVSRGVGPTGRKSLPEKNKWNRREKVSKARACSGPALPPHCGAVPRLPWLSITADADSPRGPSAALWRYEVPTTTLSTQCDPSQRRPVSRVLAKIPWTLGAIAPSIYRGVQIGGVHMPRSPNKYTESGGHAGSSFPPNNLDPELPFATSILTPANRLVSAQVRVPTSRTSYPKNIPLFQTSATRAVTSPHVV